MAAHNELGKQGEAYAAEYLLKNGYLILEKCWRHHHLELDIIAYKAPFLVVVEVKTRTTASFASPDDTVSNRKLNRIYCATEMYMAIKKIPWEVRYDLITVITAVEPWEVEHIEDAFYPFMNT